MPNTITTEQAGLAPVDASAQALSACYNLALRRVASVDARLLWPERTESGAADRPVPPGAVGPRHAFEPSPVVRIASPPCRDPAGMSHSVAAAFQPPDEDVPATGVEGDDGFDRFVREHRAMLVAFLSRRVGDEDAQDIAQETLVRLMRYRAQPVEQLRPLMYRIAINVIHDRGRRDSTRQVFAHVSLDVDFVGLPSMEPTHDQRIEHEQELALVRAAILQLPDRCRQVYLLNRIEGLSYSQIAQHCGISVKAVEKHIGKALAILRAKLKQSGVDREDRS